MLVWRAFSFLKRTVTNNSLKDFLQNFIFVILGPGRKQRVKKDDLYFHSEWSRNAKHYIVIDIQQQVI